MKEPEGFGQKKAGKKAQISQPARGQPDIRSLLGPTAEKSSGGNIPSAGKKVPLPHGTKVPPPGSKVPPRNGGNIFGFGGTSYSSPGGGGGLRTAGKAGTVVVKPGGWLPKDNSSPGSVVSSVLAAGELICFLK